MCKLISDTMSKFLPTENTENILIDVTKDTNYKSSKQIDLGVKAKTLFHEA